MSETGSEESDGGGVNGEFRALLEGLRTSLPGVQVLFAFLLIAPFQTEFSNLSDAEVASHALAFYASGAAIILLIAPSAHQRFRAPLTGLKRRSRRHLIVTTWLTIAGTCTMGVAMAATCYLVSSMLFGAVTAIAATATAGALIGWAWVYIPLVTFRRLD